MPVVHSLVGSIETTCVFCGDVLCYYHQKVKDLLLEPDPATVMIWVEGGEELYGKRAKQYWRDVSYHRNRGS